MSTLSIAYKEGFNSEKYINPYVPSSDEYNDFERGWCQRVKQGLKVSTVSSNIAHHEAIQPTVKKQEQQSEISSKKSKFNKALEKYGYAIKR